MKFEIRSNCKGYIGIMKLVSCLGVPNFEIQLYLLSDIYLISCFLSGLLWIAAAVAIVECLTMLMNAIQNR